MCKRHSYTSEEKYQVINEYEKGIGTIQGIITKYGISEYSFYNWKYNYEKYGIGGLKESKTCKKYSKEIKENAVKDYLSGEFSQLEITRKYELSTKTLLLKWVNKYNSHKELTSQRRRKSTIMTKGRKTTWKERIEIVDFCIANKYNYQKAAEQYEVSYQQVYKWVKKYEDGGIDELKDRRGRNKAEEELTPEEQMKLQIKKLQAENQRLKAENLLLKKLEELERRRS